MRFDQSITDRGRSRRAHGFTIIELLVVFAVIAILFKAPRC
jgi:prepilin-type N-terminal cleavage/methylation domain-containing protein